MKRLIPFLFFLAACAHRPMLTLFDYEAVPLGASISTIVEKHGDPDDIRFHGDATEEYVYTERVQVSPDIMEHIHYVFKVDQGEVVYKEIERSEALPVLRILRRPR